MNLLQLEIGAIVIASFFAGMAVVWLLPGRSSSKSETSSPAATSIGSLTK